MVVAQTAELLLEEAFYLESAALDPQGAIEKYQAAIGTPDIERATAARAHLRLGICYHLLGRSRKAREELERVTTDFPTETAAVKLARRILGQSVVENPARFLPPDALFFAEFVDPEKHTHQLLELLEDTPFQNPVDVYRSYLEQQMAPESGADGGKLAVSGAGNSEAGPPPATPASPQAVQASAILNEGILRELGNIQGAALCYPSVERGTAEFIFVLFPGKSHIVRGALQFYLTQRNSRVVATVGRFQIFETPVEDDEPSVYIAFSDDVVLISNRKGSVQEAIERSLGQSTSLADNQDYQATLSARSGSFIFSYINTESLLRVLEREIEDDERRAFRTSVRALGLDRLRASSVTLSAGAGDSLELSLRLNWGSVSPEAWEVFRTPHPRWDLLSTVPLESLGFLSFALDRGAERWAALGSLIQGFVDRLSEPEQAEVERQLRPLRSAVAGESTQKFLAALSQVVGGVVPTPTRQLWPSFFLILRFDEPESGPRRFEAALSELAYLAFTNEASRQFRTESVRDGQTEFPVRVLEPLPQMTIQAVDLGDRLVVATSRQTLELVLRGRNTPRAATATVPEEAFKALFLRPAAISRQAKRLRGSSPGDERHGRGLDAQAVLFEEIPSALLYSREERGLLLLTLTIPEFRSTSRAILKRLGARAPVVQDPDDPAER